MANISFAHHRLNGNKTFELTDCAILTLLCKMRTIICLGSRLDTKATGTLVSVISAPEAKIFMVDIDEAEIKI